MSLPLSLGPKGRPRMVKIEKARVETPQVRTLFFMDEACSRAEPGQFVMVWIPSVDEVPMSLSYIGSLEPDGLSAITVRRVGEASEALHRLEAGSLLGVRGPFGRGFKPVEGRVMLVGGGLGIAPMKPLLPKLKRLNCEATVVMGAATASELALAGEVERLLSGWGRLLKATDDGSLGFKGTAAQLAAEILEENSGYSQLYACGPEPMLVKILELSFKYGIQAQLSLERYIKCGVGICGSCTVGPYRICVDGPVFTSQTLKDLPEFGRTRRDASGRSIPV
ncbi:MAG: dihydroorotate dehydrogenase electron transfer subunit [Candidatus Hecatellaceae archaeon]